VPHTEHKLHVIQETWRPGTREIPNIVPGSPVFQAVGRAYESCWARTIPFDTADISPAVLRGARRFLQVRSSSAAVPAREIAASDMPGR